MTLTGKNCLKCNKEITKMELYKIIMFVIQDKFSEHHYEHVECPEKFTI